MSKAKLKTASRKSKLTRKKVRVAIQKSVVSGKLLSSSKAGKSKKSLVPR